MLREYLLGVLTNECTVLDCPPQLEYWETLLDLVEAAQLFTRQQVDTQQRSANKVENIHGEGHGLRTSTAEQTATGRTCSWQTAVSERSFNRTSVADTVAFSEANSQRFAQNRTDGFDKGTRNTHGAGTTSYTHHLSDTHTRRETDAQHSFFVSNAGGGTGPLLPYEDTRIGITGEPSATFPYFTISAENTHPDYNIPWGAVCPQTIDPADGQCVRPAIPSVGKGWNRCVRVNVSLQIPNVASISFTIEYEDGIQQRMFYTRFCSNTHSEDFGKLNDVQSSTWAQNERDTATSAETTTIKHLIRKAGTSTRRGTSIVDAEERDIGQASGTGNSNSNSEGTGFGHSQHRKEVLTTERTDHVKTDTSHAQSLITSHKYGQIVQHLGELHDRILTQIVLVSRQLVAQPVGGHMNPTLAPNSFPLSKCYSRGCRVRGFCTCAC